MRSGPAALFPSIATLGYGTRVQKGLCIGGGSAQWCQVETMDGRVSGYVSGRFLVDGATPPPAGGGSGGEPAYWLVRGLPPGDRLSVRRDPAGASPALATLGEGEIVQNLGCRTTSGTRWCRIRSMVGMDVTGWVAARFLEASRGPIAIQPPVSGGGGGGTVSGPDFYIVAGLASGDLLNIRSQPSTQGAILGQLSSGARVQNLGCQMTGQARWCRIRTSGGVVVTGWVNGRYLRER